MTQAIISSPTAGKCKYDDPFCQDSTLLKCGWIVQFNVQQLAQPPGCCTGSGLLLSHQNNTLDSACAPVDEGAVNGAVGPLCS